MDVLTSPALENACVKRVESMVTSLVNTVRKTECSVPPIPAPRKAFGSDCKEALEQLMEPIPAPRNLIAAVSVCSIAPPNALTVQAATSIATEERSEITSIVTGKKENPFSNYACINIDT